VLLLWVIYKEAISSGERNLESKYKRYSLKDLLGKLRSKFDGIQEIYIFGSRRHRTKSTRSDLDLLILANEQVRPDDVRDFARNECEALDFFFVNNGEAISCSNGSKITAKNNKDLLFRLNAVKIWDAKHGFSNADIDWDFDVIKDQKIVMTRLVTDEPLASKVDISRNKSDGIQSADIGTSIYRDYGIWALVAIVVGLLILWVISHVVATPGSEVSILWGITSYTKKPSSENMNEEALPVKTESERKNESTLATTNEIYIGRGNHQPIDLKIYYNAAHNIDSIIESIRANNKLRRLSQTEPLRKIGDLPADTYFFLNSAYIQLSNSSISKTKTLYNEIINRKPTRFRDFKWFFEFQKYNTNDIYLIGYISEIDASDIFRLDGETEHKILVFGYPTDKMDVLVLLPINRILQSEAGSIALDTKEGVPILDIIIK